MRFGEKCPQCGYMEEKNWRPRLIDIECDIIEAENMPDLRRILYTKRDFTYEEGQFVYQLSRLQRSIWRARGKNFKRPNKQEATSPHARQIAIANATIKRRSLGLPIRPSRDRKLDSFG